MLLAETRRVLDALADAQVRHWVAGGWGVDVLVGRQTREHRDLDLAVDAQDLDAATSALEGLGYVLETDWLPVRAEYVALGRGWVDLHPLRVEPSGAARQAALDAPDFVYPAEAFVAGDLDGRRVPCLSATQQRLFHQGYEPGPKDLHDLAQLDALDGSSPSRP